jgi:hypothetical protein
MSNAEMKKHWHGSRPSFASMQEMQRRQAAASAQPGSK